MPTITWAEEDKLDPYPAVIDALGHVFGFAVQQDATTGNLGGSEPDVVAKMYHACRDVLHSEDRDSLPLLDNPVDMAWRGSVATMENTRGDEG